MKDYDEFFWSKVDAAGDCWTWMAGRTGEGYGAFWVLDKQHLAHRWAYETLVGLVPTGLTLDHRCRDRSCVNPDHLEPVTYAENFRRGPRINRTTCIRGHSLADAYVKKNGYLNCRQCVTESTRRRRAVA